MALDVVEEKQLEKSYTFQIGEHSSFLCCCIINIEFQLFLLLNRKTN
jgi:hypothetical protein